MSTNGMKQRVAKLEALQESKANRQHVLEAHGDEEAEMKQAQLIASGMARPSDLFVILRRFSEPCLEREAA